MLRLLIVFVVLVVASAAADVSELDRAQTKADAVQAETQLALEDVDAVDVSETLPGFDESVRRSDTLPQAVFPNLSTDLIEPDTLSAIGELMDNAQTLAADLGMTPRADDGLSVYVFASFSMPTASLRSLITQGELADVPIVLRGLVNNSVEDTVVAVQSLYKGEAQERGAVIDPTLFERFGVTQVPTVVVAEAAAGACTPEACPTPRHVKIAGDVPLRYSLDRIAMSEPAFRHELRAMMKKLEPERQW